MNSLPALKLMRSGSSSWTWGARMTGGRAAVFPAQTEGIHVARGPGSSTGRARAAAASPAGRAGVRKLRRCPARRF